MKLPYDEVHLIADPLYGYLRITLSRAGEIAEADVIDNPWVQRLKRIHQLQSSWWVFPTAEHSRFAHSLGAMHLAGELARQVYPTLAEVEPSTPSLPLVEETLRLAGLLHDLGHGPCGAAGPPAGAGAAPDGGPIPRCVRLLHRALSGAVTVDNMDYVGRDAYMCGVALGPVDVDRLIYYTFCTADGLTFHKRALSALRAFLNARFYMYENVYFHRVGHAIDLHLHEIFRPTMRLVSPVSPLDDLAAYRRLTEWSLFTTVEDWLDEPLGSERRELAGQWQSIIHRHVKYSMVYEHHVERQQPLPAARDLTTEQFRAAIVQRLPGPLKDIEFVVDIASQDPRPLNPLVGPKRIAVYDPATDAIEERLLSGILEFVPAKAHLYRVFAVGREHAVELALAARGALEEAEPQSLTNL